MASEDPAAVPPPGMPRAAFAPPAPPVPPPPLPPVASTMPQAAFAPPPPPAAPPGAAALLPYAPPVAQARLHPLTLFFAAWNSLRGFIVPVAVVVFLRRDMSGLGWLPIAGAVAALAVAWGMLRYFTFSYWITGGELIIRSGVLSRTERHIPLTRVQDVRLKQGVLHRLLRVVEVQIDTAGGGEGAEAALSVLSQAEAGRLREAIFAHRVVLATPMAAAPVASGLPAGAMATEAEARVPEARKVVRRVSTRELVLAGLTSNQVASGLAVVGAAFALLDDFLDFTDLGPQAAQAVQAFQRWLSAGGGAALAVLVAGGVVLVVVLGLLISVVGSVLLFYGFELSLSGEDLHRSYGLFTRHASSLPRRRIQLLRIDEGLLRRMLRLATLRASSARGKQETGETEKGTDVLLPVVPRREVAALLPVVFPDAAEHAKPDWRRVSRRAIWRGTFKGTVAVLLFTAAATVFKGPAWLAALALVPVAYALNVVAYRHLGYATDGGFFRTRRGWLGRSTQIVPTRNVQTIRITQTPFDRRHGVATVQVDTAGAAGGPPQVENVPWDEATAQALELAHQAAAQRYRW